MLTLKVLNSDATLNNFLYIGSVKFVKGSDVTMILQLFQADKNIRYMPAAGATVSLQLKKSDNTTLAKSATFPFAADRSIIQVDLTDTESLDLISQNLIAVLTEGSITTNIVLQYGLQATSLTQGC